MGRHNRKGKEEAVGGCDFLKLHAWESSPLLVALGYRVGTAPDLRWDKVRCLGAYLVPFPPRCLTLRCFPVFPVLSRLFAKGKV